jgi:cupin 2 domain-containing protein
VKNLFSEIPADLSGELFEPILAADAVRIERIVSLGHTSAEEFWYDQDESEWVVVLAGAARVICDSPGGEPRTVWLSPGDHLNIPAHTRHRVAWTDPDQATIWLAIFYK